MYLKCCTRTDTPPPTALFGEYTSQFNAYVNAHAEELRTLFVEQEGQRNLNVEVNPGSKSLNLDTMLQTMQGLVSKAVVDEALASWIIPAFSTTTTTDKTVSCILMMATLKKYFTYSFSGIRCGIPRVILEGTKEDWQMLRLKAEKLKEYGMQCIAWYHLLVPILDRFVRAFDGPDSTENIEFWQNVVHLRNGSGFSHLGGWITAFCVFDESGKWLSFPLVNVRTMPPIVILIIIILEFVCHNIVRQLCTA